MNALVDDQAGEYEQGAAVGLRRQDLGALQAEGQVAARGTLDEANDDERHRQCAGVGQHMRGVREEGERVREDADDDLDGHETDDQCQRYREALRVRVLGDTVRMPRVTALRRMIVIVLSSSHSSPHANSRVLL